MDEAHTSNRAKR